MTIDIAAIRKREQAATEGPWKLITDFCDCGGEYGCSHGEFPYGFGPFPQAEHMGDERTYDDFEFAAHARQDIPALLAEVERLQQQAEIRERSLRAVNTGLASQRAELADQLHKANAEIERLARDSTAYANEVAELTAYNRAVKGANDDLRAELATANAKLAILVTNPEVAR